MQVFRTRVRLPPAPPSKKRKGYIYVLLQCNTSKNREIQRSVIAMAASPWEAMKKVSDVFSETIVDGKPLTVINVSAERDEGYECIIISDILYEDAGYKMEND